MAMMTDMDMTMAARWKQLFLWSAFMVIAVGATASGAYAYMHRDVFSQHDAAEAAPAGVPPANGPMAIGHMKLAAQFAGPLKDTVIQRWQDSQTHAVCYIYLPVVVQHSPRTPTGFVQYGANGIGSISCMAD